MTETAGGLTPEQQKANRKLWTEALRSGRYRQTRHRLKARNGAMCCLGVLCELAGEEWEWHRVVYTNSECSDSTASSTAMRFVGLRYSDGFFDKGEEGCVRALSLAQLNDEGKSFAEIAAVIESEPPGLFDA